MFGDIGKLAGLMTKLPKIRAEMEGLQSRLKQLSAEGQSGGGMVTIRVNGAFNIVSCRLSDDAMKLNDRELLEDLIASAANQAVGKVRELIAAETGKMASDLGLPQGANLPGLGD